MTFIIAIQLEDSIIVTADNRCAVLMEDGSLQYRDDETSKIYLWKNGIITGAGEHTVISRAIEFFIKLSKSKIEDLPKCLKISRLIRELEADHTQIQTSKLMYSDYTETGVQFYSIQPDGTGEYQLEACQQNEIILWLFNPDVSAITSELKNLYANLRPYQSFDNQRDWLNYYINYLSLIYKKQAQADVMMSQSFDFFFQMKDEYITGHIPNTHKVPIKFKEISSNS